MGPPWWSSDQDSALLMWGLESGPGWGTKLPHAMQCRGGGGDGRVLGL